MTDVRHYVEFYFSPTSESTAARVVEVDDRDPKSVEVTDNVYAFRFFDLWPDPDGASIQPPRNVSGMYFPGGEVVAVDDIHDAKAKRKIKAGLWDKAMKDRFGNWRPLQERDEVM